MHANSHIDNIDPVVVRESLIANGGSIIKTCDDLSINEQKLLDIRAKHPELEKHVEKFKRGERFDFSKEELKKAFEENEYSITYTAYKLGIAIATLRQIIERNSMGDLSQWHKQKREEFLNKYGKRNSVKRRKLNGKAKPSSNVVPLGKKPTPKTKHILDLQEDKINGLDRIASDIEVVNRKLAINQTAFANVVDRLEDRLNHMSNIQYSMVGWVSVLSCGIGSLATYLIMASGG